MEEYINKRLLLEKAKKHQNSVFGIPLIIAEIEKAPVEFRIEDDIIARIEHDSLCETETYKI